MTEPHYLVLWILNSKMSSSVGLSEELLRVLGELPLHEFVPTWSFRQGFGAFSMLVYCKQNTQSKFFVRYMKQRKHADFVDKLPN